MATPPQRAFLPAIVDGLGEGSRLVVREVQLVHAASQRVSPDAAAAHHLAVRVRRARPLQHNICKSAVEYQ